MKQAPNPVLICCIFKSQISYEVTVEVLKLSAVEKDLFLQVMDLVLIFFYFQKTFSTASMTVTFKKMNSFPKCAFLV